jgi:hypothetical protein
VDQRKCESGPRPFLHVPPFGRIAAAAVLALDRRAPRQVQQIHPGNGRGYTTLSTHFAMVTRPTTSGGATRLCPGCRSLQARLQTALRLRKRPSRRLIGCGLDEPAVRE